MNSSTGESGGDGGSSFSSSNSGIGLISKEPASNVAAKELSTRNVISNTHIKYDFPGNSTCIICIEYDAERTFLKTTTTVEELKNKSIFVPTLPYGIIYKYVNIWLGDKGEGQPTSLKNGLVEFRVEKSWINDNNVNESLVTLQWYNKSWEPLYTRKVGEDNNYAYFESRTSGFSSFAITEFTGVDKNGTQIGAKLQGTLRSLENTGKVSINGSSNNSRAQKAREAAKILMAISLPLTLAGYFLVRKKL